MDEEQATMAVSLEESAPEIVAPPVTEVPAATTDATAAPVDDSLEPDAVAAANGEKYVPLAAVRAERERRKEAEAKIKAHEANLAPLQEKAQRYDEARQYLDQAKPYIEKAKADLQREKQQAPPAVDPRVEQYAKDFDLYTPEGKPDVERAQRIIAFHREDSKAQAAQLVSPLLQNEATRTTNNLFQHFVSQPEVNGIKINANYLREAFNMVGADIIAQNPNVAQVLFMNTIGRQMLEGQKPTTTPAPVVPTESLGGNSVSEERLTAVSERFRQATDMKPEAYKEVRSRYKPGVSNSLE